MHFSNRNASEFNMINILQCEPNLRVNAAISNIQNTDLHELAFFAEKTITKGEPLTIDYKLCI